MPRYLYGTQQLIANRTANKIIPNIRGIFESGFCSNPYISIETESICRTPNWIIYSGSTTDVTSVTAIATIKSFAPRDRFEWLRFEDIPDIIHAPDYISIHPKKNSISFIKDYSQHVSVAVRISLDGKLSYRTMYPITDAQLQNYLNIGRAKRYNDSVEHQFLY